MIPRALEAEILRLHHIEQWPPGTIARQLRVHHSTVRRVLAQAGLSAALPVVRPAIIDPYRPFIAETLTRYPTLRASRLYQMVRERSHPARPITSAPASRACVHDHRQKPICACAPCPANKRKSTGHTSASLPSAGPCAH